jgi:thermostable 8-oxoguanine DNA glycosylase
MPYLSSKEKLATIAKRLAAKYKSKLDQLKQEHKELSRPDFIWHYLLQSFSTMGRAAGWRGLIGNKENYSRITYDELEKLSPEEREQVVRKTCKAAKIRRPDKKADFILGCYTHIQNLGGLIKAKETLLAQNGREGKIQFLMGFPGIGPKYARNIMVDVYHEDFRDSIAIDIRIKAISNALGVSFSSYSEHEQFYLDAAKMAGLNGWELDRLLFYYREDFENEIAKV